MKLIGWRLAVMDDYQKLDPIYRFQEAGAKAAIGSSKADKYLTNFGYPAIADVTAKDVGKQRYDSIVIPGGYASDLRLDRDMVELIREHATKGKIVAAICHETWLLTSADTVKGRETTGAPSIQDDLQHAGGTYEDCESVRDGNTVTSRKRGGIPAFCSAIFEAIASTTLRAAA